METTVVVDAQGRLTLPESVRRELGVDGKSTLRVKAEEGRLVVQPEPWIPPEDAWAYTPKHLARIAEARAQAAAGQAVTMTEAELRKLAGLPPAKPRRNKGRQSAA